jgi:hypothetical protein
VGSNNNGESPHGASTGSNPILPAIPPPLNIAHTHAYALAAEDEAHLLEIEQMLIRKGIPHTSIREPDSPYNGQLTAIGCWPTQQKKIRKLFFHLKLLGTE